MLKRILSMLMTLLFLLPTLCAAEEAAEPTPAPTAIPYAGYVYVLCGEQYRWYPLPLEDQEEYEINVRQTGEDGTEYVNTIHFTHDGVYMAYSTCENQDCVNEGLVTLTNKDERVLGSWIVCLPQQVSLQLYTADELMALLAEQTGVQE